MEQHPHYGQVFKELRKNRQFTLKQVANTSLSLAQLSKFERGDSDLSLRKFISALDAINVSMAEFMDKVNHYEKIDQANLMTSLHSAYFSNDLVSIEQLMAEQEEKWRQDISNPRPRLNAILCRLLLCQLDEHRSVLETDLDTISDYLFQIEEWGLEELILVANTAMFYPTELICRRAREIIKHWSRYRAISRERRIAEGVLLNTITILVERGDLLYIPEFEQALEGILSTRRSVSNRLDYLYTKGFYKQACGDSSGVRDMKHAIFAFKVAGADYKYLHYKSHFEKYIGKDSQI